MSLLVGTSASDEDSAAGLLLKTLLVDAFRANYETYEVDSLVLRKVDLRLVLDPSDSTVIVLRLEVACLERL